MQFLAFGREISREATETRELTVKSLIHTTAGTILIIAFFACDASENRTCVAEVSS